MGLLSVLDALAGFAGAGALGSEAAFVAGMALGAAVFVAVFVVVFAVVLVAVLGAFAAFFGAASFLSAAGVFVLAFLRPFGSAAGASSLATFLGRPRFFGVGSAATAASMVISIRDMQLGICN